MIDLPQDVDAISNIDLISYGKPTAIRIMLNTPVLVRSLKLSNIEPSHRELKLVLYGLVSTWMGDRLGTLGAVGFQFSSFFGFNFRRIV